MLPQVGYRAAKAIQPLSQGSQLGQTPQEYTRGRAAQGRGRLKEEGNSCGASWGSEIEGLLQMKSSFSPLGLSSLKMPFSLFFSECLSPQGRPLSLGRVGASIAVWGALNDASLITAGGVGCFRVTAVLFLLLATSHPCHTGLLVLVGLHRIDNNGESRVIPEEVRVLRVSGSP